MYKCIAVNIHEFVYVCVSIYMGKHVSMFMCVWVYVCAQVQQSI